MNSFFFRVYGGILAVLISVLLLGLGAVWLVNDMRTGDYRERIATGTFRLMADNLEHMDDTERKRALAAWTRLIGVPLELRHLDDLNLENLVASAQGQGGGQAGKQSAPACLLHGERARRDCLDRSDSSDI